MDSVTSNRVRPLSLEDLRIVVETAGGEAGEKEEKIETLPETDELLIKVRAALDMSFAGVILSGPPGTGKSWYAKLVAFTIADEPDAVRIVQFHTSYQYEDFMEGFSPHDGGGFELQKKTFALLCDDATERPDVRHVLLIDEISRCDVARVFGEALTYIEIDKRGQEFTLASGSTMRVPPNLILLATMNPWDKGVDELDIALERRFAQIDMPPSSSELRKILEKNGAAPDIIDRVVGFFESVQRLDDEMVHLGHAYFINCIDEARAHKAWEFRLLPFFKKACRLDRSMLDNIIRSWRRAFPLVAAEAERAPVSAGGREGGTG
jgi:5-methylcytosine-specific restriction enzyme B